MATNYVYITLDTTAPANPTVVIEGGALAVANQLVGLTIHTDDDDNAGIDKTGYMMKIWGSNSSIDESYDSKVTNDENTATWFAYTTNPQVKLSAGDGTKTINVRVRDAVNNPSNVAIDSVNLDATIPTITVTYTAMTISEQAGKDTFSFTFQSTDAFTDYKVMLVTDTGATDSAGTQIQSTNGSTYVQGNATTDNGGVNWTSSSVITVTLKAQDLRLAGANMNGQNIIKPFVKNEAGVWSA